MSSAVLIIQSQFTPTSNVLILPQLVPQAGPIWPNNLPPFNAGSQNGGIEFNDWDIGDCLDCWFLYRDPLLQYFWFPFYNDACAASSSDTYLTGEPALIWATHLVNGPTDPYWATVGTAPLPTICASGGQYLTNYPPGNMPADAGCFVPAQADQWVQVCGVKTLGDATLTGTINVLFQYGSIRPGGDPPVGETGITVGPEAWRALNPTNRGAPTPYHISGCGCNSASEREEEYDMATTLAAAPSPRAGHPLLRRGRPGSSLSLPRPVPRFQPSGFAGSDFARQSNNPANRRR